MKIITLCGSLKFKKEMIEMSIKMGLQDNCILTPIFPVNLDKKMSEKVIYYKYFLTHFV